MKTSEAQVQRSIVKDARVNGWLCMKVDWSQAGYPDLIIIGKNGMVAFVEVKRDGEKPRPLQQYRHAELVERKQECHVVDSLKAWVELKQRLQTIDGMGSTRTQI